MPESLAISIQPASALKSQRLEIAAISAATSALTLNRFGGDSAAILRSALDFNSQDFALRIEIVAIAILRN